MYINTYLIIFHILSKITKLKLFLLKIYYFLINLIILHFLDFLTLIIILETYNYLILNYLIGI